VSHDELLVALDSALQAGVYDRRSSALRFASTWSQADDNARASALMAWHRALQHDDAQQRARALELVTTIGADVVPALKQSLADDRPGMRRLAIDALSLLPHTEAFDLIAVATHDPHEAVRSSAVEALAKHRPTVALSIVAARLPTETAAVALTMLLCALEHHWSLPLQLIRDRASDPMTAAAALQLLARRGDLEALLEGAVSSAATRRKAAVAALAGVHPVVAMPMTPELRNVLQLMLLSADEGAAADAASVASGAGEVFGLLLLLSHPKAAPDAIGTSIQRLQQRAPDVIRRLHDSGRLAGHEAWVHTHATTAPVATSTVAVAASAGARTTDAVLSDAVFERLVVFVEKSFGLVVPAFHRPRIDNRLRGLLKTGQSTTDLVVAAIAGPGSQRDQVIDALTIHETYFFRETTLLNSACAAVVATGKPVTAWCAGCSTGEEAYSTYALLRENGADPVRVVGTDVSSAVIDTARQGRFTRRSMRTPLPAARQWLFGQYDVNRGTCEVAASVREQVTFAVANLMERNTAVATGSCRLVVCRNVLIYLSDQARSTALAELDRVLAPGGILVLGHSESLLHGPHRFELLPLVGGIAYRKGH
jgi:chemotaxis protein methyltransferase CheR